LITSAQIRSTTYWLAHFGDILVANPPIRLHVRSVDGDGNPDWHPEFVHWLTGTSGRTEGSEDRARLKRAMKRLHERSLREYEVLTRVLVRSEPIPEVTEWLNVRAITGKHPERYRDADTLVILYAAIDKIRDWY
jgi:hypothetical protein